MGKCSSLFQARSLYSSTTGARKDAAENPLPSRRRRAVAAMVLHPARLSVGKHAAMAARGRCAAAGAAAALSPAAMVTATRTTSVKWNGQPNLQVPLRYDS